VSSRSFAFAFVLANLLAGCAIFDPPLREAPEPAFVPAAPFPADSPAVALVLSGGGARGFAHVGVIKALEANGLRPDLVVGTSAGSIVGALYASGLSPAELEAAVREMDGSVFADLVLPSLGFLPGALGFIKGDRLHRFVDRHARVHRIEDFPIRLAVVATDLKEGTPVVFNAGGVGAAVRASSAAPGLIAPVEIGSRLYGDGQISSPLPVALARSLGARKIIAVDVLYRPEDALLFSAVGVVFQAFNIATHRLKEHERVQADAVIEPVLRRTSGQFSFGDREWLIAAGEEATLKELPRLRVLFAAEGKPSR
jgi:NTE family protein